MTLSSILFLFLAHLGVGIAFTLVFVSREAGVKFFRFNSGLAAILLVIAVGFTFSTLSAPIEPRPGSAGIGAVSIDPFLALSLIALVASTGLMVLYWSTVGRILTKIRPAILALAVVTGVIAVALQGLSVGLASRSWPMVALTLASFLTSAAMLGGACTAMILGHWYLVIPSLEVSHLQSIVRVHIASMAARVVVVVVAVWVAIATWNPNELGPSFRHYIFSIDGIFFWQRVLFGLAGPAVLSYLTWETAKIRSTQSATGILYVDFFTVVVGEVLAKYIVLATRVPV
jgi:protein NrfD